MSIHVITVMLSRSLHHVSPPPPPPEYTSFLPLFLRCLLIHSSTVEEGSCRDLQYLLKSLSCFTLALVTIFPLTGLKKPGPPYRKSECFNVQYKS